MGMLQKHLDPLCKSNQNSCTVFWGNFTTGIPFFSPKLPLDMFAIVYNLFPNGGGWSLKSCTSTLWPATHSILHTSIWKLETGPGNTDSGPQEIVDLLPVSSVDVLLDFRGTQACTISVLMYAWAVGFVQKPAGSPYSFYPTPFRFSHWFSSHRNIGYIFRLLLYFSSA